MTAKEAIMILESIQPSCGEKYSFSESEIYEAIDMAIEALKYSEIPNCSEPKCADGCITDDIISRADLLKQIDTDAGEGRGYYGDTWKFIDTIKKMPPAQPEKMQLSGESTTKDSIFDCISRQAAIDEIDEWIKAFRENGHKESAADACLIQDGIIQLPSAQPERDIPIKPNETTDKAWGIPHRQAVCPKCDYYLGHVAFLGDYKGKRITYCETCGQAIDWEGWEFDE